MPKGMCSDTNTERPIASWVGKDGNMFYKHRRKMNRATLVVVRANLDPNSPHVFANSAPCARCCANIQRMGIKSIVYSDGHGRMVKVKTCDFKTVHQSAAARALKRDFSLGSI